MPTSQLNNMSSPSTTPNIDILVCARCNEQAFAWMEGVFPCPMCGESEYRDIGIGNTTEGNAKTDNTKETKETENQESGKQE